MSEVIGLLPGIDAQSREHREQGHRHSARVLTDSSEQERIEVSTQGCSHECIVSRRPRTFSALPYAAPNKKPAQPNGCAGISRPCRTTGGSFRASSCRSTCRDASTRLLSRYPSPFLSAVENTIFESVAASSREMRPSRLVSSVSNCARCSGAQGARVLSLSPPKADQRQHCDDSGRDERFGNFHEFS